MKTRLNRLIQYIMNSILIIRRLNYLLSLEIFDRNAISWENCIVIQGPITSKLNLLAIVETSIRNTNSRIIISTWTSTSSIMLMKLEKYVDHIVLTEDIEASEFNVNRQMITTFNGLAYAKKRGCKFAIKNRTDCILYNNQLFDFYQNHVVKLDSINERVNRLTSNRLVVLDFYSSKYKLYHLSDFFMLGYIDDLLLFWSDIKIDVEGPKDWSIGSLSELSYYHLGGEGYLYDVFLKKIQWTKHNSIEDYYNFIKSYFYLIDRESAGWKWLKKSIEINYPKSKFISDENLTTIDWYNIFYGTYNFSELKDIDKISIKDKSYYYN